MPHAYVTTLYAWTLCPPATVKNLWNVREKIPINSGKVEESRQDSTLDTTQMYSHTYITEYAENALSLGEK